MQKAFENEWKKLFKSHILDRGWDYYQSDCVCSIKPTEDGFTATVDGTEPYTVDIIMHDGHIIDMTCDCPYADDDNYCKHMAAVLYEITEEHYEKQKQLHEENQKTEQAELEELISRIPEKDLRKLVLQYAVENSHFRSDILLKYAGTVSSQRIRELKEKIYEFADEYSDQYGYIDWENAYEYVCDLENYLHDTVQKLLENNHCMEAFELVCEGLSSAADQDMEDNAGGLIQLADTCYDLWEQILEECSEEQQAKMYEIMKNTLENRKIDEVTADYIQKFLMYEFHDKSIIVKKLETLDAEIEEGIQNQNREWSSRHHIESNLIQRIMLMMELAFSKEDIAEYRNNYREFPVIRAMEVDEYVSEGNITAAIEILKESKKMDESLHGMVEQYSKKLMALYSSTNQKAAYKQELCSYIFTFSQGDLEYIYKLKETVTENEWKEYCEQILTAKTCTQIRYDFLVKEEMHEQLLDDILKEEYIGYLDRYEQVLKKKFPIQVRDRYISYVKQAAQRASHRNAYKDLMVYLKKIKKYPDGTAITAEIASGWRSEFRRRPAMMNELKMAGF